MVQSSGEEYTEPAIDLRVRLEERRAGVGAVQRRRGEAGEGGGGVGRVAGEESVPSRVGALV